MGNSIVNTTVSTSTIHVNGVDLYHEIRGSGPPVLFIQGATGDGGTFEQVAELLADEFTVVTYHRRCNSLSPCPGGEVSTTIDEQADDAAALLRALGLAPAVVFGTSMGAVILLNVMLLHPDVLRGAIIHEPPLVPVLSNGAEIGAQIQAMVEEGLATKGPRGTMELFLRINAGDANFENLHPTLRKRMLGNAEVFFFTEMEATVAYVPDAGELSGCTVPALVIAGIDSQDVYYHEASA